MQDAYLSLVLHAHLPFVRHPEHQRFLEEIWLYEAISETYLPLLRVFERLASDGIPFRLCLSVSPSLAAMLQDELLRDRYVRHLQMLIELADREAVRTREMPEFHRLTLMYLSLYQQNLDDYSGRLQRDLLGGFRALRASGHVDLITTCATHAFLPLLDQAHRGIEAQIKTAVDYHAELFDLRPRGFWLPECGYYPGLEEHLARHGLDYFFVDSHAITNADVRPRYGVFAPLSCPNGVLAFGRDPEASRAVWSAEEGYPADISYREFYRDIGFDLPLDVIGPYIIDGKVRVNTGFKYYAITGRGEHKVPYNSEEAQRKVQEHADNFIYRQQKRVERLSQLMDRVPLVLAPFDAELFGHWWYEGPDWIEALIRKIHTQATGLKLVTPEDYMKIHTRNQTATPSASSWGNKGYSSVWLDGSNDWVYRHIHESVDRMGELAERFAACDGMRRRILNQAAREVLLMQASDWAFIMKAGTSVPYAERRTREHIHNFDRIYTGMLANNIDLEWLAGVEKKDNLFPDIDYSVFA